MQFVTVKKKWFSNVQYVVMTMQIVIMDLFFSPQTLFWFNHFIFLLAWGLIIFQPMSTLLLGWSFQTAWILSGWTCTQNCHDRGPHHGLASGSFLATCKPRPRCIYLRYSHCYLTHHIAFFQAFRWTVSSPFNECPSFLHLAKFYSVLKIQIRKHLYYNQSIYYSLKFFLTPIDTGFLGKEYTIHVES